jgi:hypothetical protein
LSEVSVVQSGHLKGNSSSGFSSSQQFQAFNFEFMSLNSQTPILHLAKMEIKINFFLEFWTKTGTVSG